MTDDNKELAPQTIANKKWYDKNKEKGRYLNKRSHSRSFIKNLSTLEDLEELKELIRIREAELLKEAVDTDNKEG